MGDVLIEREFNNLLYDILHMQVNQNIIEWRLHAYVTLPTNSRQV